MTVRQCLCKTYGMKPGMLVYRHYCGGTIIGEVKRVNERSVRIRKLNDSHTCMSDEHVTLKFKRDLSFHQAHMPDFRPQCWCVTDVHELTPEVAQEKYFRELLVGCNPYIAKKIGWTERMSAAGPLSFASPAEQAMPSQKKIDELVIAAPYVPKQNAQDVVEKRRSLGVRTPRTAPHPGKGLLDVTALINAGKYRSLQDEKLQEHLRADLELSHDAKREVTGSNARKKLDTLWALTWKHAHAGIYGLHDVVYWYNELWPLIAPQLC